MEPGSVRDHAKATTDPSSLRSLRMTTMLAGQFSRQIRLQYFQAELYRYPLYQFESPRERSIVDAAMRMCLAVLSLAFV
jgi:hypothetical protein